MLISANSSNTLSPTVLDPVAAAPAKAASSPTTASSAISATPAAMSGASTASVTNAHGGSSGSASASNSPAMEILVSGYSTTVGKTRYSGNVEESRGEYVASVPDLFGATANGSDLMTAENNLTVRIDEFV